MQNNELMDIVLQALQEHEKTRPARHSCFLDQEERRNIKDVAMFAGTFKKYFFIGVVILILMSFGLSQF